MVMEVHGSDGVEDLDAGELTYMKTGTGILEEQHECPFCETVIASLGSHDSLFFEEEDEVLCCRNRNDRDLVQVLLSGLFKHNFAVSATTVCSKAILARPVCTTVYTKCKFVPRWPQTA